MNKIKFLLKASIESLVCLTNLDELIERVGGAGEEGEGCTGKLELESKETGRLESGLYIYFLIPMT